MTIDVEKTTADGRRALRKAQKRASKIVDQARAVELPTLADLGHRLDQVPGELEQAAKRVRRSAKRTGLVPPTVNGSGGRTAGRTTGIVLVLGICVAAVVFAAKKRRGDAASETADPFGTAVRDAEEAKRAGSSSMRA